MFCTKCGAENEDGSKFCVGCGATFEEEPVTNLAEMPQEAPACVEEDTTFDEVNAEKKEKTKKIITVAVIAVVAVAIVLGAVKLIGGLFADDEIDMSKYPLLYVKDGEMNVLPEGKKDSYKIADASAYSAQYYTSRIQLTDDGKGIFFADELDSSSEFDLYFRKTNDTKGKDGKGKKIAKDISGFAIIPGTTEVIYQKDEKLCYNNLKDERVIVEEVGDVNGISQDGKKLFYEDKDGVSYIRGFGKNDKPEKIDSDVSYVSNYIEDYKTIYYTKEDKLYKKELGKKKEKLASDVDSAFILGKKVFVIKADVKEYKFDDLFINDVKDEIKSLIDPDSIKKPNREDFEDYEDYSKANEKYWDEYYEAREEWNKYDYIEDLEKSLNETPKEITTYSIHELKGKKLKLVDENIAGFNSKDYYENTLYYKNSEKGFKRIKLSDADSRWDAESKVNEQIYSGGEDRSLHIITAAGKGFLALESAEDVYDYKITEDGKKIYILHRKDDQEEGTLAKYNIGSSKLSGKKIVAEDIATFALYQDEKITADNKDNEKYVLKGKKKISLGENVPYVTYNEGVFYFIKNFEDIAGELCVCENGKIKKISDNVTIYKVFGEKRIAYIANYDEEEGKGELFMGKKNGKAKLIDGEVSAIVW
ncbi:MAG: zinc ribbon domain-containing protein [Clostridia bacterium]|nr:zinc ribbon domain-containing protein [Clostridia bacterium]